jgi:hypothetical protein
MRRLILALLALLALPAVARAQITATFLQTANDPTDATSYTFAAQNLGTAASDRYITVVTIGRKTGTSNCTTPSALTIGGVSASYINHRGNAVSNCNVVAIHKALVPTGTTGDIVITWGFTYLQTHIAVYRSTGGQTTAATVTGSSTVGDPALTHTIAADGYSVGGSVTNTTATATWTGLTETYDEPMVSGSTTIASGALLNPGTLQTSLSVVVDWTASGTETIGVYASWSPVSSGTTPPTNLTLGVGLN